MASITKQPKNRSLQKNTHTAAWAVNIDPSQAMVTCRELGGGFAGTRNAAEETSSDQSIC